MTNLETGAENSKKLLTVKAIYIPKRIKTGSKSIRNNKLTKYFNFFMGITTGFWTPPGRLAYAKVHCSDRYIPRNILCQLRAIFIYFLYLYREIFYGVQIFGIFVFFLFFS